MSYNNSSPEKHKLEIFLNHFYLNVSTCVFSISLLYFFIFLSTYYGNFQTFQKNWRNCMLCAHIRNTLILQWFAICPICLITYQTISLCVCQFIWVFSGLQSQLQTSVSFIPEQWSMQVINERSIFIYISSSFFQEKCIHVKCINLNYTIQWVLTNMCIWVTQITSRYRHFHYHRTSSVSFFAVNFSPSLVPDTVLISVTIYLFCLF